MGLTAELLEPVEFDSISTIKKKLLKMTPMSVSDLAIDVMKKGVSKKRNGLYV
ncbi:hypothetical protein JDS91_00485 [Bacillus cereus]|uniref:hypothetical protein n=1 Tax=Bacillus cereus TaxID=1396 RepID=UPI0018F644D7|nr:hypothetical protein [Bacillus cereus]